MFCKRDVVVFVVVVVVVFVVVVLKQCVDRDLLDL